VTGSNGLEIGARALAELNVAVCGVAITFSHVVKLDSLARKSLALLLEQAVKKKNLIL